MAQPDSAVSADAEEPGAASGRTVVPSTVSPEDAEASPARLWTKDFVLSTLVNFLFMLNYFILMVTITDYTLKAYGAPASIAGLASSIFIIGALIARFFAGSLMELIGRKRMLLVGALCTLLFSCLYFLNSSIWLLLAIRLLHGVSYGVASTAIGTISASIIPRERKGEGIGYYALSITFGAAIGPFLGMFLIQQGGSSAIFLASAIAAAASVVLLLFLKVAEPGKAAPKGSEAEAAVVPPAFSASERASAESARRHPRISKVIEIPAIPISIVCMITYFCYSSLVAFLTPYSAQLGLQTVASFFFIVFAAAMFVSRPFTGRLFDSKGARVVIVPAFVSFMAGLVLISQIDSGVLLLVSAALCGFGVGTIQSSGLAVAMKQTPEARLSLANSTYYILLDVGLGIGPFILGFFLATGDYRSMYLAMAAVALAGLAYYLFTLRKRKD